MTARKLWHTFLAGLTAKRRAKQQQQQTSTQSLPLSHWHVALSWLDLVTDVLAAISTRQLALQLPSICGMRTAPFFNCCFSIQLLLIAGSLAMQVLLAVVQAAQEHGGQIHNSALLDSHSIYPHSPAASPAAATTASNSTALQLPSQGPHTSNMRVGHPVIPSVLVTTSRTTDSPQGCCTVLHQPGTVQSVAWAVLRGLTATELAYQEFGRRMLPSASRTAAVMHIRMSELVFEGPQVVISWMVLMGRLTIEELARASDVATIHVDTATKVLQWISLVVGVVSLSVGCTDFMRLHGRSMWAGPPPAVLFLGLIDISKNTWRRSALISSHALSSLFTRAFLYIIASSMTLILAFFDVRHNRSTAVAARAAGHLPTGWPTVALQVVFPAMIVTSFLCNITALHPMRHWMQLPAAIISCFVNIPWIAAPAGSASYGTLHSLVPAALLQLLSAGAAFALACISLRPIQFMSPCDYEPAQLTWLGSPMHRVGASVMTLLLPVLVASTEIFFFCTLAVVVDKERKTTLACASGQHAQLNLPSGMPPTGLQTAPSIGSVGLQSSGSGSLAPQHSTGAPALAYKFVLWKKPFLFCAVRVTGHPLLPVSSV